jgi:hypothetical protein
MSKALDQETYRSTRQAYDEAELEVSGRYDKWVLTLSGGALGLSITFIEKIAKNPTADTLFWLKVSWACLILSLLFELLSLITSQSAIRENRRELDLAHSENRAPGFAFPRRFTNITNGLNWGSLLLFVFGITFLCIFSFPNIDQSLTNGEKKNGQETSKGNNRGGVCTTATSAATEGEARIRSTTPTSTAQKEREINNSKMAIATEKESPKRKIEK